MYVTIGKYKGFLIFSGVRYDGEGVGRAKTEYSLPKININFGFISP